MTNQTDFNCSFPALKKHSLKSGLLILNDGQNKTYFDRAQFDSFEACINFLYRGEVRFCKSIENLTELKNWESAFASVDAVLEHLDDYI
ncbi:hypothetical protein [Vibrio fluvialis]|uniref:hypothetical protein n=1 Tax=Vibrio fluvialis TaxID=676 RepID=UPI00192A8587|nr:hypothetical protein [Vibrio fluvialis]MBL4262861.1 hypothetical protein [Vibrio fluvialis]